MNTEKTHVWHRIEPTALLLSVILIPPAVWWATSNSEHEKTRLEYVRVAIGVLQPTEEGKQPQKELRGWAVQILQDSARVKLSPAAAQALVDGESHLPRTYSAGYDYDYPTWTYDYNYEAPRIPTHQRPPSPKPK